MEENRNQESIYNKTVEKEKENEHSEEDLEETVFTTGALREPEINSPADIYKHFPRGVVFEDELSETEGSSSEEIGTRENNSDSDDQFSDDNAVRLPPNTQKTGTSVRGKTVRKMLSQETSEEAAAELLQSYQETLNIREKTKQNKTKNTHTNKTGFVVLLKIRRSCSELSRDKGKQGRNGTSHSWSTENVKRSASKLTSSQLLMNETFTNKLKTWLAMECGNAQFKDNADMQPESPEKAAKNEA